MNNLNKEKQKIYSEGLISRLSQYLKYIVQLKELGKRTVTSQEISNNTDINSAEVRRDLIYFGITGKRGVGYDVEQLSKEFNRILGYGQEVKLALIGAGNLGKAILNYKSLGQFGFKVENVFDNDTRVIDKKISGHKVLNINQLKDIAAEKNIEIAILAVTPHSAQRVTDILVNNGFKVIINYTSVPVKAPSHVNVQTTDPIEKLLHTLYYLSNTGYKE